jgi:hypothetical protein
MPALYLAQDRFQVVCYGFCAFAAILNFDGVDGYRVGEIGLAR